MRPNAAKILKENRLKALVITNPVNVRYITGVATDEGLVLVLPRGFQLFVNPLEYDSVKQAVRNDVTVKRSSDAAAALKKIQTCAFEEDHVTVGRLKRWKKLFASTKFTPSTGLIEQYRRTKDADELSAILKANAITEDILHKLPRLLKAGVTEVKVSSAIESWARLAGAEKMGFETIVAFGTHTSRPHHRPTDRVLKKKDVIQIDMGVVIDGYTSDRSAVFFVGAPTAQQQKVLRALTEAKNAGIEAIAPNVPCSAPDRAAREVLKKYGFEQYFIHSLGHGVGLDIHEGISLSSRSKDRLKEGEVVTVEPGVYIEGKWGMRLEDMVIVQ